MMLLTPLLPLAEFEWLAAPRCITIGPYRSWSSKQDETFVVEVDARPLAELIEDAAMGARVYELMMIRRPGDVLRYLCVRLVEAGEDVLQGLARLTRGDPPDTRSEWAFVAFDDCFFWQDDDTPPQVRAWLMQREGDFWRRLMQELFETMRAAQGRLREGDDALLQHELHLIDTCSHRRDFMADALGAVVRPLSRRGMPAPAPVHERILTLIQRDDVHSVSCPFDDYPLWRALLSEQRRRVVATGLPPQEAFCLCGPDSGLPGIDFADWDGEVHIPYEGACGADLFVLPIWRSFNVDLMRAGKPLSQAVGNDCHHVLLRHDHGELPGLVREAVGEWTLYTSTSPYRNCNPFRPSFSSAHL